MPRPKQSFSYEKGEKFDFYDVLKVLGDLDNITQIEYSDCYIIRPQHWAVLLQILTDLPQVPVIIWTLETDTNKKSFPSDKLEVIRTVSYNTIREIKNRGYLDKKEICFSQEHDSLLEQIFETELEQEVKILRSANGAKGSDRLPHYRFLKMSDSDGKEINLYFDSGVSAFDFDITPMTPYFDDNREKLIAHVPTKIFIEIKTDN